MSLILNLEITDSELLTLIMSLAVAMERLNSKENYDEITKLYNRLYALYYDRLLGGVPKSAS